MRYKMQGARFKKPGRDTVFVFNMYLVGCISYLFLAGCGFHLRGATEYGLPPALATLRVTVQGSTQQYDPLRVAMTNALRTQAGVDVVDAAEAPVLLLFAEKFDRQLLSVDSTGKAEEYLLRYAVSFRVTDKDSKILSEPQTVRVQRYFAFDRLNVLANEREESELRRDMQNDAVQQILRRLAAVELTVKHADQR